MAVNDTAAVILANAAGRPDLRVFPLPKGLKVNGAAANRVLEKLVRTGLLATIAATRDDVAWAEDEETGRTTLVVTNAGLAAIGIEADGTAETPTKKPKTTTSKAKPAKKAAKRGHTGATAAKSRKGAAKPTKKAPSARTAAKGLTKQQLVVGMLRRPNGASIAELVKATEWQPHSVRGVLTATVKGRLGLPVISEKGEDGIRRYFVAPIQTGKGKSS
jgi:hypothetical protein